MKTKGETFSTLSGLSTQNVPKGLRYPKGHRFLQFLVP